MYNPKYLQALDVVPPSQGAEYTTFTDLDTKTTVEMLVEPSERSYNYSAEYNKLPVKGTKTPLLTYMQSEVNISFPSVLFYTYGNQRDLVSVLNLLSGFTQPIAETGEPPVLKLSMGKEVWERVRLSKFTYRTKMARDGYVLMAEGSFDILIDPLPPKQSEFKQEVPPTTPPKLSQPEQASNASKVKELLDKDVAKAKKYNYTKGKSKVEVDDAGKVKIDGKDVGYLKDILGTATPPGLNTPSLTKEGKKKEGANTSGM